MVVNILIITADVAHAAVLERALSHSDVTIFNFEVAADITKGIERIECGGIDAIFLDLSLPGGKDETSFDLVLAKAPHTPIIVIGNPEDETLALQAVHRGAYRYLAKNNSGGDLVAKSLEHIVQGKKISETLFIEKSRAEITLNSISDAVISTDTQGNVDYLNLSAERMTGWPLEAARGKPIHEVLKIINGTTREPDQNPVDRVLQSDEPMGLAAGTILIRRDGSEVVIEDSAAPIHDSGGSLCGAVIVFHDISESKAMTKKMAFLAQHDFLTNLPNRVLLNDRIRQAIMQSARLTTTLSVLFLDLDNFKDINDSLGHDTGDELLRSVAARISSCVRNSDTLSRAGGDEFVLLIPDCHQAKTATVIARKILKTLAEPHLIGEHILRVTTSIGISTYPEHGRDAQTLIQNADEAMYEAKKKGRNNFQIFSGKKIRAREKPILLRRDVPARDARQNPSR